MVFLFVGGPHQVAHLAPVAEAVAGALPPGSVRSWYLGEETGAALRAVRDADHADRAAGGVVTALVPPRWVRRLPHRAAKLPALLARWSELRAADLIVTPERTSA